MGVEEDAIPGDGLGDGADQFESENPEAVEVRDLLERDILSP